MEEEKFSGGGGGSRGGNGGSGDSSLRASSSFVKSGDRQMFTVELRQGETTIVSWKKLVKDANKVNGGLSSVPELPAIPNPAVESLVDPGQPAEAEGNDAPGPNRFNAVIEKIERLYMGKDSSDEEDLIPDDDQYDTEDSFIDDTELDEYFEVDNSAVKHDGFFVNRGKLERTEPSGLPTQQLKKRRRKDLDKGHVENNDGRTSNKHAKVGKTATGKTALMVAKSFSNLSQNMAITQHLEDDKLQNQLNIPGTCSRKKSGDTKLISDPSPSLKVYNGDTSTAPAEAKDIDLQKPGIFPSKNLGGKIKESCGPSDSLQQKPLEKSTHAPSKPQPGRPSNSADEVDLSVQYKEKHGIRELPDINLPAVKYSMQTAKTPYLHKKDGSSVRPKSSMLEKAIRELEKMVAESRPPVTENADADNSLQAVKRRLPREIKLKLAKVARLAASQGKLTKGLINRLMSFLGHLIQLRTLKRNLKVMVNMGLSAKQEKDDRFQQIRREVVEMIKIRPLSIESKVFEQQAGAPDDSRELVSEERGASKKKFIMDPALEDKICDLYDLFVDGLDEDAGPQIRKLYAELAELWPNGFMDNHGIKRAICRAKERRRTLHSRHKDQEKFKRKKMLAPRVEETVRSDVGSVAQPQYTRERLASESGPHSTSATKPVSTTTTATAQLPNPSLSVANSDRLKSEKSKGSSINFFEEIRMSDGLLTKKKAKRKAETEMDETHVRPEKLPGQHGDERHRSMKPNASLPPKSNLQSAAPPSLEQSS